MLNTAAHDPYTSSLIREPEALPIAPLRYYDNHRMEETSLTLAPIYTTKKTCTIKPARRVWPLVGTFTVKISTITILSCCERNTKMGSLKESTSLLFKDIIPVEHIYCIVYTCPLYYLDASQRSRDGV